MPKSVIAKTPSSPTIDPDGTTLDFHLAGVAPERILVFAELLGDAVDGRDVMDFAGVRGHAARTEIADAGGVQLQGNNLSSRWALSLDEALKTIQYASILRHESANRISYQAPPHDLTGAELCTPYTSRKSMPQDIVSRLSQTVNRS